MMVTMSQELLNRLAHDPNVLIHQIDAAQDRAAVVALTADQIRNAAFLDQRAITPQTQGALFTWQDVVRSLQAVSEKMPMMIFHIGHCGSTLLSKLIEEAGGPRGLREPLPLRSFAMMESNLSYNLSVWPRPELNARMALFLRSCASGSTTAIKATSICNNLISPALESGVAKAIFAYMPAKTYLAAMLGGENAPIDIYGSIELRMRRLRVLCEDPLADLAYMSLGECAALCWACETATTALAQNEDQGKRILAINFDQFLKTPGSSLERCLAHFDTPTNNIAVEKAISGPMMTQYSKAPEHQFSPNFREQLLAQYQADHASEIAKGMNWLETNAKNFAPIAKAMNRFND